MFNNLITINYLQIFIIFVFYIVTQYYFHNFDIALNFYNIKYMNVLSVPNLLLVVTILSSIYCFIISRLFYIKNNTNILYIISFLFLVLYGLVNSNTTIGFFYYYELTLFPSILLVYYFSSNKRAKLVTLYFLVWTQLGSFLVLLGIIIIYKLLDTIDFICYTKKPKLFNSLGFLFIFGFGIKIPIWPFHFWLTKTHVEASTAFSIFLSGILVKIAIYGLWQFRIYLNNIHFIIILISSLLGVYDTTLKLIYQVDIKKLVAYLTIQEMSILYLMLGFSNILTYNIFINLFLVHTILSSLLFFLADCISRRSGTRLLLYSQGFLITHAKLSKSICATIFVFIGLPFTIKFYIEAYLIIFTLSINLYISIVFIFLLQYITIIFFFYKIINILYGCSKNITPDLLINEIYLIYLPILLYIFLSLQ